MEELRQRVGEPGEIGAAIRALIELEPACKSGDLSAVQFLLREAGVDPNHTQAGFPLIEAARAGHLPIVRLLVEAGANVDQRNTLGWNAFNYACTGGFLDVMEYLHGSAGVDLDAPHPKRRWTSLHGAASHGALTAIQWLVEHGADPNACNNNGETPLHYAVEACNVSAVAWLVGSGKVDVNAQRNNGNTALHLTAFVDDFDEDYDHI